MGYVVIKILCVLVPNAHMGIGQQIVPVIRLTLQISTIFNHSGPIGGHFGGLVDIATKMGLANG
jgi:hypothetical protein